MIDRWQVVDDEKNTCNNSAGSDSGLGREGRSAFKWIMDINLQSRLERQMLLTLPTLHQS